MSKTGQLQADYDNQTKRAKYYEQEYKTYKQKWDAAGKLQEVTEAKVRLKDEELNEAYAKIEKFESSRSKGKKKGKGFQKKGARKSLMVGDELTAVNATEGLAPVRRRSKADQGNLVIPPITGSAAHRKSITSFDVDSEDEDVAPEFYKFVTQAFENVAKALPHITIARVLEIQKHFTNADTDASGLLELHEFNKLLKKMSGTKFPPEVTQTIFEEVDSDKSGHLDFVETVTAADKLDRGEFRLPKKHEKDKAKKGVKGKHDEDETKTCIIS